MDKKFFPFESYIASMIVEEYNRDIRRKNYLIKYVNLMCIDNLDAVTLNKLLQSLIFFRNVFSKDAFLLFFNETFTLEERQVVAPIVYDLFVCSKVGDVGEYKDFITEAIKIEKIVDRKHIINNIWLELKTRQEIKI